MKTSRAVVQQATKIFTHHNRFKDTGSFCTTTPYIYIFFFFANIYTNFTMKQFLTFAQKKNIFVLGDSSFG